LFVTLNPLMSNPTEQPPADLQFDRAEFVDAPALACKICQSPISDRYFEANGQVICEACQPRLAKITTPTNDDFLRAGAYGVLGAIAGAALWATVVTLLHARIGIVALAVGWLVGKGVRKGSRNRGGPVFQAMAVVLTYLAVAGSYMPALYEFQQRSGEAVSVGALALIALVRPVTDAMASGMSGILGLLIVGFGLMQAWQVNRETKIVVSGPYPLSRRPGAATGG
jgi:hypothetical protein